MHARVRETKTKKSNYLTKFTFKFLFFTVVKLLVIMLKKILSLSNLNSTKMVIIIRTDINMGKGKIASQAAHAAVSLYQSSKESSNPYLKSWLRFGQPKIVLKVETQCEQTLENVFQTALKSNLTACLIRDAGRTQISTGTITAVGIGPAKIDEIDKITKDFKLL